MLRRAVISKLKTLNSFEGRVYQAYLVPVNTPRPYLTVKFAGQRVAPAIRIAGSERIEVRIYNEPTSFLSLDSLEAEIVAACHGTHEDPETGNRYELDWQPSGADFHDNIQNLIGRLVVFEAAVLHEKGG